MNARKKSKQPSIASEEGKRKWPAAWGEPSKEERPVPPPKWKIWIATRRVSLQNAILLSLDYDPTFFRGESISHLLDNDPVKGRFKERLEMLRECHTGPTIRLSDFASLAESEFNWEGLPDQLKELTTKPAGAPEAQNDAATGDARLDPKMKWTVEACRLALEYIARHKKNNLYPTQKDVCKHVANEMREQKIYGSQARPLEPNYIQRNAIQGEWWQANKP